mgnify:CR=1 FL=1
MKYKKVGKSGLITSNLTLGTMIFGEGSGRSTSEKDAVKIIDRFLDAGGNHIDTADAYAGGRSEEIVGKALKSKRDDILIATKVRFRTAPGYHGEGLSRRHILQSVNESLQRLQTDYIDLLYLHCIDPLTPLEETIRTLDNLVTSGKVRYIGISNFKAWQFMKAQSNCRALGTDSFIAAQYQYSLVKRDREYEFLDFFQSEGIGLLPWSPLGGGFLTGKYSKDKPTSGRISMMTSENEESWERRNTERNWRVMEIVEMLAKKHQASPSQISIAWMLPMEVMSSSIIGARTMEQLEDNLGANYVELSDEDLAMLNEASQLPELYPYRFISDYGKRELS